MTRDPGDEMYRGGRLARAVASLLGPSPVRSQSPFRQPGSNTDWVRTGQEATLGPDFASWRLLCIVL